VAFVALLAALIPLSANADWLTYHLDPGRLGNDSTDPTATTITAAWASPSLDGAVYAEPLIFGPNVLVATENNTIYSLDAGTGEINWQEHLGTPVPNSSLPCGNVNPVGITGTPVIDGATHTIYAVGMLFPTEHPLRTVRRRRVDRRAPLAAGDRPRRVQPRDAGATRRAGAHEWQCIYPLRRSLWRLHPLLRLDRGRARRR